MAKDILEAKQVLENRESAVRKMMDEIEKDLELVGATGVEDLLQEGVSTTLQAMHQAGIKIWVLTGDKVETAVSIAHSCGHFNSSTAVIYLTALTDLQKSKTKLQEIKSQMISTVNYGLVVDGTTLILVLEHLAKEFYHIASKCHAVTCCRMSPKQKAQVVQLVKHQPSRPMCAAIGDGANDVSMIQEAHVGIGIMGKEGRQAVQCADFAFSQFRFLQKALLVHGHWYYIRVATFVHYNFYKNVVFNTPIFLYTMWSAFSTQSVYESLALTFFNISMTTLPIMAYGLFEQYLPSSVLQQQPHLYKEITRNKKMGWKEFFKWNGLGLYHSLIMYFGVIAVCWGDTAGLPNGQTVDLTVFGMTLVSICVCIVNFKIIVETRFFCGLYNWSVLLTLLSYAALYLFYSGVILYPVIQNYSVYWSYYRTFECPTLLLAGMLIVLVALTPDVILRAIDDIKHSQTISYSSKISSAIKLKSYSYINEDFVEEESDRRKTLTENSSLA
ncbi:unnamed protein product [Meganyctiphanes norvegica]|uniref:P-type phospholipid transporter n=1 Tax=Meganyctiphanes norvegica TaxID=48144 RepID=A0AAV2RDL3_MEGNR